MPKNSLFAVEIACQEPGFHITIAGVSGRLIGEDWVSTVNPFDRALESSLAWLHRETGCPMRTLRRAVWDTRLERVRAS